MGVGSGNLELCACRRAGSSIETYAVEYSVVDFNVYRTRTQGDCTMYQSPKSELFSDLSTEAASQTKGGYWGRRRSTKSVTVLVPHPLGVVFAPARRISRSSTLIITNPEISDCAIVNFSSSSGTLTLTNPVIDDGAIVYF